jgi:hypothetical protein
MPRSSKWSLQVFQPKLCMHFSLHMCHVPCSFNPHRPNNILWWVQIVKLLIMQFSPVSCYFLPLCPSNFLRTWRVIIVYKREPATIQGSLNPHKLCGYVKLLLNHCEIFICTRMCTLMCWFWLYLAIFFCIGCLSRWFPSRIQWFERWHWFFENGATSGRGSLWWVFQNF